MRPAIFQAGCKDAFAQGSLWLAMMPLLTRNHWDWRERPRMPGGDLGQWILILAAMLFIVAGFHFAQGEMGFAAGATGAIGTTPDADEVLDRTVSWGAAVGPNCYSTTTQAFSAAPIHELVIGDVEWPLKTVTLVCTAGIIPRSPPSLASLSCSGYPNSTKQCPRGPDAEPGDSHLPS